MVMQLIRIRESGGEISYWPYHVRGTCMSRSLRSISFKRHFLDKYINKISILRKENWYAIKSNSDNDFCKYK